MIKYELIESYLLSTYRSVILPSIYEILEETDDLVENAIFAIGAYEEETNTPVGAAVFDQGYDEVLNLISIYVDPDFRRQKIGTQLVHIAFSVVGEDENSRAPEDRYEQYTFICNYRMEEEIHNEFEQFMLSLNVVDFFNLPEGIKFKLSELKDNNKLHNAFYNVYETPEFVYKLDDMIPDMNLYIRDNTSPAADGEKSFVATDEGAAMYCSVIEQIADDYYRLYLVANGEDNEGMFRAFEATVANLAAEADINEAVIDVLFRDAFAEGFVKSLDIKNYKKMLNSQAVMVVDFAKAE